MTFMGVGTIMNLTAGNLSEDRTDQPQTGGGKVLTMEEAVLGYQLYPKNLYIQWQGDRNVLTYPEGTNLMGEVAGKEKPEVLMTLAELNRLLEADLKGWPQYEWKDGRTLVIMRQGKRYEIDTDKKVLAYVFPIAKGAQNVTSNGQELLAYTKANNLYYVDANGNEFAVTSDEDPNIVNGQTVSRNEFGINGGIFWSPDGKQLAFYRKDESQVGTFPLLDINSRMGTLREIKYPMAGMASHEVKVGIYHTASGDTVYLRTPGEKDQYLTNIAWSPDEKNIYLQRLNRRQDTCRTEVYDATDGKLLRTLFTETSDKYVEPQYPVFFLPGRNDRFVHLSRRDGYHHLYLYNTDGKLLKQLTSGAWEVLSATPSPDGKSIFITSNEESPLEINLYKVSVSSGKRTRLTPQSGVHRTTISSSGKYVIDLYANHETPRITQLISTTNGKTETLLIAENPYKGYETPSVIGGTLKAADGTTDLYYRVTRPPHFDPEKKYPVIVYVYGGPHAQMVTDSWLWGASGNDLLMAARGYVVFTLDNRGSANRGLPFEDVTHHRLGEAEMADQMQGIDWLRNQSWCDTTRIGVHGWSFGGFMTTNLMLTHGDVFKVGVAGGPVIDWKYYEIMYGERYMGTPQANPEGYKSANLNLKAGNLQGHLMLIHCDTDPVVVWQHSLSFLKSCIKAGTYPDYFVYPGHAHNVIGPERVHLYEKVIRYFDDYLK